jgi:acyl carrier protein
MQRKTVHVAEFVQRCRQVIAQCLDMDASRLHKDLTFAEDLEAAELDQVYLVEALQSEFGIEIESEPRRKLRTVGDVLKYVGALAEVENITEYVDRM